MPVKRVPITGSVLNWAMQDADLSEQDLAEQLRVSVKTVHNWLSETEQPSTADFRALASAVSRPPSFLLLPKPPQLLPINVAFRTLRDPDLAEGRTIERDAIRLAQRLQQTARWLGERLHSPTPDIPRAAHSLPPDEIASRIVSWLQWSTEEQVSTEISEAGVTQLMRSHLQDTGIVVLHLSLTERVVRGFSLPDERASQLQ